MTKPDISLFNPDDLDGDDKKKPTDGEMGQMMTRKRIRKEAENEGIELSPTTVFGIDVRADVPGVMAQLETYVHDRQALEAKPVIEHDPNSEYVKSGTRQDLLNEMQRLRKESIKRRLSAD